MLFRIDLTSGVCFNCLFPILRPHFLIDFRERVSYFLCVNCIFVPRSNLLLFRAAVCGVLFESTSSLVFIGKSKNHNYELNKR